MRKELLTRKHKAGKASCRCETCGAEILAFYRGESGIFNKDGTYHSCKKCKIYTPEEIEEYKKKRGL